LNALAERTPIPSRSAAHSTASRRSRGAAAYYVVAEALTNVAKYADASGARVSVERATAACACRSPTTVSRRGRHRQRSSGLRGLADRVEALGGRLAVTSEPGHGTTVRAELPLDAC